MPGHSHNPKRTRITIRLTERDRLALARLAAKQDATVGEVVRRAIEQAVGR